MACSLYFPSHNFWFLLQIAKLKSMTIFYGRFNPFTIQTAETDICTRKMTLKKNQPASICIRECFAFRSKSSFFKVLFLPIVKKVKLLYLLSSFIWNENKKIIFLLWILIPCFKVWYGVTPYEFNTEPQT